MTLELPEIDRHFACSYIGPLMDLLNSYIEVHHKNRTIHLFPKHLRKGPKQSKTKQLSNMAAAGGGF